jgi:hypothetical protein
MAHGADVGRLACGTVMIDRRMGQSVAPGVWWVVEWILTPGLFRAVNNEIALEALGEMAGAQPA